MFTAEQLYEILKHKDGTGIGRDGQVKNKAGAALYSLWEDYKNKSASELDLNEAAFSIALNTMMEKADRGIRNGLTRGGFKQYFDEYLKGDVSRFGTAY